jgi:hypothetical protein
LSRAFGQLAPDAHAHDVLLAQQAIALLLALQPRKLEVHAFQIHDLHMLSSFSQTNGGDACARRGVVPPCS